MINEEEIYDWNDFKEKISEAYSDRYHFIFRGHSDRDWKLESTLTRLIQRVSSEFDPAKIESEHLKNFRMKIRGLRGKNPPQLNDDEIWSLGQHYGLATPLLDWSESPYIAAYFAFENPNSCDSGWRTIYALNKFSLIRDDNFIKANTVSFITPMVDENPRIVAQAGLFTKTVTGQSLEDWLTENNLTKHLTKFHIEDSYRLDAINDLRLMNITGSTIYPDLHGASIACNMFIESMSENYEFRKKSEENLKTLFPERYSNK